MYPQFSDKEISVLKRMMSQYYENQCSFGTSSGVPTWGTITGSIESQTDLATAFGTIDSSLTTINGNITTINGTLGSLSTDVSGKIPLTGSSSLSGSFLPSTPNVSDFGDGTYRFRGGYFQNLYASGKAFVGPITSSAYTGLTVDVGLTSFLGGTTTLNGALLPNVSGLNIGGTSTGQHWDIAYVNNIDTRTGIFNIKSGNQNRLIIGNTSITGAVQVDYSTGVANRSVFGVTGTFSANSGTQRGVVFANTFNQSSSATGIQLLVTPYLQALGSGGIKLASIGYNSAADAGGTHTEVFGVDNSGDTYTAGNALFGTTTKAGYRIDVNGTSRFQGVSTFSSTVGIGTIATTHALTFPASSTGIALHNQSDQTTNWEAGRLYWSANNFNISTESGGTGAGRNITLSAGSGLYFRANGVERMNITIAKATGMVNLPQGASNSGVSILGISGLMGAASGMQYQYANLATINQSSTAGYVGYYASIYEQTLGSGPKLLMDLGINSAANGGGTHTSRATIDNTGVGFLASRLVVGNSVSASSIPNTIHASTSSSSNSVYISTGENELERIKLGWGGASATAPVNNVTSAQIVALDTRLAIASRSNTASSIGLYTTDADNIATLRMLIDRYGVTTVSNDIVINNNAKGLILYSPNNTAYRINVTNAGVVQATPV